MRLEAVITEPSITLESTSDSAYIELTAINTNPVIVLTPLMQSQIPAETESRILNLELNKLDKNAIIDGGTIF